MLIRLLTTVSFLVLVVALNTNTQYFTPNIYTPKGDVLAEYDNADILFQDDRVIVSEIVDGDTIKIGSGEIVRYIGIDTPETKDTRKSIECFGEESSRLNAELVKGKLVRLEKDISDTDRYGRLLRYVYVELDGEEIMVNKYLIKNGYAKASTYPPDIKYVNEFVRLQGIAMNSGLGLWSQCN